MSSRSHGGPVGIVRHLVRMDSLKLLLQQTSEGNEAARTQLFAVAYDELRSRARAQLRDGGRNTLLDTTVLVHESYLRFLHAGQLTGAERGYFFSYAAQMMRSMIVVRDAGSKKQSAAVLKATIERWRVASCAAHFDQRSP